MPQREDTRRMLPSVDRLMQVLSGEAGLEPFSHRQKVEACRAVLSRLRSESDPEGVPSTEEIVRMTQAELLARQRMGLRRVVNGTGIVLHTGLGRAVLAPEALEAVAQLSSCCNLQLDLETGTRGRRDAVVEELLRALTGAEAATVVNNNAAATLLVLAALCRDREVIVSRGQLIEIGGSFRLPDVIAQSGACLVEVGTTNKTHLRDYAAAITDQTAVILRVNPSNYRIVGFTQDVSTEELATLKAGRDFILVDDLGCGNLVDLSAQGLPREPTLEESISAGADVAISSGDKLLGGPQSGLILGRKDLIDRIRQHPLMRAVRVGKFTIAALEATLKLFLNAETVWDRNPTLHMLALPYEALRERATALAQKLSAYVECEVAEGSSASGGGALPHVELRSAIVSLRRKNLPASEFARRLRLGDPPVIALVRNDAVCIDVRTLLDGDEERIGNALMSIVKADAAGGGIPPVAGSQRKER